MMRSLALGAAAMAVVSSGCAAPRAVPPDTPPPPVPSGWEALTPAAQVRMDGVAVYLDAGGRPAIAANAGASTPSPPSLIRAQLWKMSGAADGTLGVAFGVTREGGESRGCVVQLRADGAARLAHWERDRATMPGRWVRAPSRSRQEAPPAATGALAIHEVLLSLDTQSAAVSVDGLDVFTTAIPAHCLAGSLGVYADSGVVVRVAYLFGEGR